MSSNKVSPSAAVGSNRPIAHAFGLLQGELELAISGTTAVSGTLAPRSYYLLQCDGANAYPKIHALGATPGIARFVCWDAQDQIIRTTDHLYAVTVSGTTGATGTLYVSRLLVHDES